VSRRKPRPPLRCPALRVRTPEEAALVAAAVKRREVWVAYGPVAGACGHRHLSPLDASRCVTPARPTLGRYPKARVWRDAPPGTPAPSRSGWVNGVIVFTFMIVALAWASVLTN
jgi:hypothetical protein